MSVGLDIKVILREKKMNQKVLGISKVSVSCECKNQTLPSIQTLGSIGKVLKVRISDLIVEN